MGIRVYADGTGGGPALLTLGTGTIYAGVDVPPGNGHTIIGRDIVVSTDWQISVSSGFGTILWQSLAQTAGKYTATVPAGTLTPDGSFYARWRANYADGSTSPWAPTITFTATTPAAPPARTITLRAYGAGGSNCPQSGRYGGRGGYITAVVDVPIGATLYIIAGQGGSNSISTRTYGEGGRGRGDGHPWNAPGGGLSGVFAATFSTGMSASNVICVAGGGGGASSGEGGDGGGTSGGNGSGASANATGGTPSAGGVRGASGGSGITQDGSFLRGGDAWVTEAGGGGGGGFYGGGGGSGFYGGGGGGSSAAPGGPYTASSVVNTSAGGAAANSNGYVTLTYSGTTYTFGYTGSQQTHTVT